MRHKEYLFRFKQFAVSHAVSSMHVGVDAVLLGAVAGIPPSGRLLDVGTGCGVIALIAAQRSVDLRILAIDVDIPSVEEATENFLKSPWSGRMHAEPADFSLLTAEDNGTFDMIISNPPYFDSGGDPDLSSRMRARHQATLSPMSLITHGKELLTSVGRIAMIFPVEFETEVDNVIGECGMCLLRKIYVAGRVGAPPKRIIIEAGVNPEISHGAFDTERIEIEESPGKYTPQYIGLCKDLYLKF